MDDDRIAWHPALLPALQLTFEEYLDVLDIQAEQPLNREPLRIDALIIKKERDTVITNPIARIWRWVNVVEYKSPSVTVTPEEFYKGLVYVFLYASLHQAAITEMSLSVLVTKESGALRRYIREEWKYEGGKGEEGIYYIEGLPFPVQIVEVPKLSAETNRFLRSLNRGLDEETMTWAIRLGAGEHRMDVSAYIDVIARANKGLLKEMLMRSPVLEELIEEVGLAARWEARGRREGEERRSIEIAQNLIKKGWDSREIAETTGLDLSTVETLYGSV